MRKLLVTSALLFSTPLFAATVSLTASGGNGQASLSWTVSNGSINAQEVYQDTDSNPAGRVRIASPASGARTHTVTGLTNGTTYYFWIKARQTDNVWVNSNAASAAPSGGSGSSSGGGEYHWPITGNLGTHDPTIINENGTWWQFQTGPGIYGKVSRNGGLNWEPLASILSSKLSWWSQYVPNQVGTDVWAPDIEVYNGRAYLYYSISTFGSKVSAIGLLSAPTVAAGGWRDDGVVISTNNNSNYNAIDPDLVIDANGAPRLSFGSWNTGIKLTKLGSNMKPTGTLYSIASRSGGIEAPNIIHRNGYYYLFVSTGTCCQGVNSTYQIRYGRSTSITGTYVDKNGTSMMSGGGSLLDGGNSRWVGPGGQDIEGTGVIARHAYDAQNNGNATLLISNLRWDSSGWPMY
jgi:arabinan endo-1,5-alpha-L-arabinosidase